MLLGVAYSLRLCVESMNVPAVGFVLFATMGAQICAAIGYVLYLLELLHSALL